MQSVQANVLRSKEISSGFTMMEVLVTLVVISLALLGTAGLQTFSVKVGQGGQFRTQAVILGLDILERMEANNAGVVAGNYRTGGGGGGGGRGNCAVTTCTAAALASYDISDLNDKLTAQLPGAKPVTITQTGTGPFIYTVAIQWEERVTKQANTAATGANVTNAGATETFSYTATRTFIDRSKPLGL